MINFIKRSAVIVLLLIVFPLPRVLANTAENPSVEESEEQPIIEESTEQQGDEESTEESAEGNNRTTEESPNEYVPPQNQQPQYEETTEVPYQSYEEPTEEFYYEEETAEKTGEEWTEEVTVEVTEEVTEAPTEEMTQEETAESETVEENSEVTINQEAAEAFSIAGNAVVDDTGLEGLAVTLSGAKEDEATTDENGEFSFKKVPPGEYELQVEVPEGYTAEKETMTLTVEDRGKRGITFVMEEKTAEESIENDEQVMSNQDDAPSTNLAVILVGVMLLSIIGVLFLAKALRK